MQKCLPLWSDAGKAFGEIALMNEDSVRTASIISDEDCDLMVINRTVYNATLKVSDNYDSFETCRIVHSYLTEIAETDDAASVTCVCALNVMTDCVAAAVPGARI